MPSLTKTKKHYGTISLQENASQTLKKLMRRLITNEISAPRKAVSPRRATFAEYRRIE
ncbi:MAG TPA: hypothetical protein VIS71_01650 [Terrimicrobium sp.]